MKKLSKLKLNYLSKADLKARQMNVLWGGGDPGTCSCGCNGSSSISSNCDANTAYGYSSGGSGKCCTCPDSWSNSENVLG